MLQCNRQNYHHVKMPKPGEIVHIVGYNFDPPRKAIVVAYPLTDNWQWYGKDRPNVPGRGIHTAYVRYLDNGEVRRLAWQWLLDEFDYGEWADHHLTRFYRGRPAGNYRRVR